MIVVIDSPSRQQRLQRQQLQPKKTWMCRTFGVFLFGTLCVSFTQLLFSIQTQSPTSTVRPLTTTEQLLVSKENFRGPVAAFVPPPLDDPSIPPSLRDFQKQQQRLQQQKVPNQPPDLSTRPDYHVVFSTSCSLQQHWESYVFFYHAMKVQQPGNVTRIVSACTPQQQAHEQAFFDQYIRPMRQDGRYVRIFTSVRFIRGLCLVVPHNTASFTVSTFTSPPILEGFDWPMDSTTST